MRNLATVFLAFILCVVSANGKILAKESGKNRQLHYNRSFRDTLWEKRLKEWEKRQSAVPQSLPRAAFKSHKHSSSRSYRASHHHRTRHVRHGRTHVRRRSRR